MRSTLLYLIARLGARLPLPLRAQSYRLVAQPVAARPRLPARRAAAFTSRPVAPGDPALAAMPLDDAALRFRFAQGATCLGLFKGEALAAYAWFCLDGYDEDEVRCRFEPAPADRTAWDFDVYVLPDHRGSFAFLALWDAADAFLRRHGRVVSMSRISAVNAASTASHASLGATPLGRADFCALGPAQVMWTSIGGRRQVAVTLRRRPVVKLEIPAWRDTLGCQEGPQADKQTAAT
ncbi:hypothetical protein CCR85_05235 [Rhodothalassium salexigens]|nr:hypothetical protein [Rhodothalassium salexigens]MBK5920183.1 hypothetical protein [Rhodothalassium salexigens]